MKTFPWLCIAFLFFSFLTGNAQKNVVRFHSINTVGVAVGQSGGSAIFQSVNGVRGNKWFTGLGIGGDYYRYDSYPLFIDTRGFFFRKENVFTYADIGYNFSGRNKPGKEVFYYDSYSFSGGIYTDLGVGYRTKFIKKTSILISAGHRYKEMVNKVGITSPCLVAPCPVDYSTYKYRFGSIVLKAGIDF